MKPFIGLPSHIVIDNGRTILGSGDKNLNAITKNGGIPIIIPVNGDLDTIDAYLDKVDGVFFLGGNDVHPYYYGEEPLKEMGFIYPIRDEFEIQLFKRAFERKLPILGICRGCQVINVAKGGTLYQDIYSQVDGCKGHSPSGIDTQEGYHTVKIDQTSKLYDIMKEEISLVNSFHHQCVKDLAEGFKATAYSTDSLIEAFEYEGEQFCLGIQWHPECMIEKHPKFNEIFKAFIESCK